MTQRRVAVIGAGDMGARHAQHWASSGAQVGVVCDADAARSETLARLHGGEGVTDALEAVRRDDVDAVSICTPTFLHAPITIAALEAGKHVLCEKPIALTLEDARAMEAAARTSGGTLRIGFMRRFDPLWRRVESDARDLGAPVMAQAALAAGIRPKLLMHDARANGGPVIDMACHVFDRWERVFGRPLERVRAVGHTFALHASELAGIEHVALDTVQAELDYGEAGTAQLQLSWGLPRGVPHSERHTYLGPGGMLEVDGGRALLTRSDAEPSVFEPPVVDAWHEEIHAFTRELDGEGPQGLADVQAGIRALRASLAVLEAVRTGEAVDPATLETQGAVA